MSEPTITCPHCQTEIKLTESLAAPLLKSKEAELHQRLAQQTAEIDKRAAALREQAEALAQAQNALEQRVADRLAAERKRLAEEEHKKARLALGEELETKQRELQELGELLKARNEKLAEAQKAQAEVLRRQRELEEQKRELDLTIEKRVSASIAEIQHKARQEAEEQLKLKVSEKDLVIQRMQKQLEEMQRKAEQGSQQLQGEVQELQLEALLANRFPRDTIVPVPKGEFGGDALHRVYNAAGGECGTILWESKRTRNWSDAWLVKLRQDQRAAKADLSVIVSQALPRDVDSFDLIDGVYVVSPRCVVPVATTLRQALLELSMARQASEGRETKMEMVYEYLMGPRFRQRIQAIVEAFSTMQEDLNAEKKAIVKQWAKRETQIERVMSSTAGLLGDFQGIAGKSLPEIEGLSFAALELRELQE